MYKRIYFNITRDQEKMNHNHLRKWAKIVNKEIFWHSMSENLRTITSKKYYHSYNSDSLESVAHAKRVIELLKNPPKGLIVSAYITEEHGAEILGKFTSDGFDTDNLII